MRGYRTLSCFPLYPVLFSLRQPYGFLEVAAGFPQKLSGFPAREQEGGAATIVKSLAPGSASDSTGTIVFSGLGLSVREDPLKGEGRGG